MALIDIIAGARPNFMKIAPIIHAINAEPNANLAFRLIHTGQHYDAKMSSDFFTQLNIPEPHHNLGAGGGTQAEQTSAIMCGYEKLLLEKRPNLCLVVGDVTSTMACAIAAKKACVLVAHVEAGIRSGDRTMPEEINRLVTDSISDYFLTTTEIAGENLRATGVPESKILFVGNTMIDTLQANLTRLLKPDFYDQERLQTDGYLVMTLHRPSNVDEPDNLQQILKVVAESTHGLPIVFPVHPRTRKNLEKQVSIPKSICIVDPQPYLQFIYLVKNSKAVVTDSGGVTEETTVLGIPCMTLRDSTERPETVTIGTNRLLGTDTNNIAPAMQQLFSGRWQTGRIPAKWDGKTGKRIVMELSRILGCRTSVKAA